MTARRERRLFRATSSSTKSFRTLRGEPGLPISAIRTRAHISEHVQLWFTCEKSQFLLTEKHHQGCVIWPRKYAWMDDQFWDAWFLMARRGSRVTDRTDGEASDMICGKKNSTYQSDMRRKWSNDLGTSLCLRKIEFISSSEMFERFRVYSGSRSTLTTRHKWGAFSLLGASTRECVGSCCREKKRVVFDAFCARYETVSKLLWSESNRKR